MRCLLQKEPGKIKIKKHKTHVACNQKTNAIPTNITGKKNNGVKLKYPGTTSVGDVVSARHCHIPTLAPKARRARAAAEAGIMKPFV